MASFADLVRAQRQSGKSVATSLSGAYNQMNMQKYDPRNALFARSGVMTALFPGLKGYQVPSGSDKSPTSLVSQSVGSSPTALSSIARDARISARNSMALPSIARNMSQMVRIWGGTPAKYFERAGQRESEYESKRGVTKKTMAGLTGSSGGGKGFNILGMLGTALGGVGSLLGSVVGGVGSIISSILGGIASLVGGAFSGIFGILGSALSGMGIMGIVVAGIVGFTLYSLWKSFDFSKIGGGIGKTLEGLNDTFKVAVDRIASGLETALVLFKDMGTAVLQDMYGFMVNLFQENKGKILGMIAIGAMGALGGFSTLTGAGISMAIAAAMAAYGKMTGEKSIEEMRMDLESTKKSRSIIEEQLKTPNMPPSYYETRQKSIKQLDEKIKGQEAEIQAKEGRTGNTQSVLNRMTIPDLVADFNRRYASRTESGSTSPTPAGSAGYSYDKKITFNSLTREQQNDLMYEQARREGSTKPGTVGFRHNNPGNIIAKNSREVFPEQAKFGGVPGETITHEGVTRTFVRFPNWQAGWEAQRDLWSRKYGNMDLQDAIKKWVNPSASEMKSGAYSSYESALMKVAGAKATPIQSPPNKNENLLAKTDISASDSMAALVYGQVEALDRMMGGELRQGSVKYSDMLRDITKEFMSNPTFVDSSQTVNNNMPPGLASAVTGSAYNPDVTPMMAERLIVGTVN